jgi:C1A family cysteine protease
MLAGYPVNEDSGLTIRDGYKSVNTYSVCSERNWPYIPEKFSEKPANACYDAAKQHKTFRYISLENDQVHIKKSLKDGFPVSFGAALFDSFMSEETAKSGIVPIPNQVTENRLGGHAMTIVGHDDSKGMFLVCNNWGDKWGLNGFCWIPYTYIENDSLVGDLWSPRWFS